MLFLKVGGKFVDTPAILDRDLDNNISKNGYKLSEDGKRNNYILITF